MKGILDRSGEKIHNQTINYVKSTLLSVFDDTTPGIRNNIANAITALFIRVGMKGWPELIQFLDANLASDRQDIVESSLECIGKLLEDMKTNSENIDLSSDSNNSITNLIPKLMILCVPQLPWKIRDSALYSLNLFISSLSVTQLDDYFQILTLYSEDQNHLLRKRSCEGFLEAYELKKDLILRNLERALETILKFTMDDNNDVKRIACRFWNEYLLVERMEAKDRILILKNCLNM